TMSLLLHSHAPPPSASGAGPDCTPALDALVSQGLSHDLGKRFATAAAFAEAAEECGVRVASSRVVASYLTAMLGDKIAERRALVSRLTKTLPPVEHDGEVSRTSVRTPEAITLHEGAGGVGVGVAPETHGGDEPTVVSLPFDQRDAGDT